MNNKYSKEIESYINAAKKDKFLKTRDLEKFNYDTEIFKEFKIKKLLPEYYNLSANKEETIGY